MSIYGNDKVSNVFNWKLYKRLNKGTLNINCVKDEEEETYERHWLRAGRTEGLFSRMCDKYPGFDWREYKRLNPDLYGKLQNTQTAYEIHYIEKGIDENRLYKIDLSAYPNFDWTEYKRLNPDLEEVLNDKDGYEIHWLTKGYKNGRIYSLDTSKYSEFNVKIYRLMNTDLKFDSDNKYIKHFLTIGHTQNRPYILDFSDIPDFNVDYYKRLNPDLQFNSDIEYKVHYYVTGKKENRTYKIDFSDYLDFELEVYKKANSDLVYLTDLEYKIHFLSKGKNENRLYKLDFSNYTDFDVEMYKKLNTDIILKTPLDYKIHYLTKGINENRLYKLDFKDYPDFNVEIYKEINSDLILKNDLEYKKHWLLKGISEDRLYKLDMTEYPDFDLAMYKLLNSDLELDNDIQYKKHWLIKGISEGRLYKLDMTDYPDFDVVMYKRLNADLDFKCDELYKKHWLTNGKHENRPYKFVFDMPDFDVDIYKRLNPDLVLNTNIDYQIHYSTLGKHANRPYKIDYKEVTDFNVDMYKRLNPDIVFDTDIDYIIDYLAIGKDNGRKYKIDMSSYPDFDITLFKALNKDLIFGDNPDDCYIYWLTKGVAEGRMYKLDLSEYPDFDVEIFKAINKDLVLEDDVDYKKYWLTKGVAEGRMYKLDLSAYPGFDVELFKAINKDLVLDDDIDYKKYWLTKGVAEGRMYKLDLSAYPGFDVSLFKKLNKDLVLEDHIEYKKYWLTKGYLEGRLYTIDMNLYDDFDWYMYKNLNPDITLTDSEELYIHYFLRGKEEGKQYKLDRTLYPDFNWELYRKLNPDLIFSGIMIKEEYEIHWMNLGRYEKRHYSINLEDTPRFDWRIYKIVNKLELENMDDLKIHWMTYGKKNNLVCNLELSDYTDFDLEYYKILNTDLDMKNKEDYQEHWMRFGRYENRKYKMDIDSNYPDFHWIDYRDCNIDLIHVGLRTKKDFELHWLQYGKNEGRVYKDNNTPLTDKLTNTDILSSIKLIALVETLQNWNNIVDLPRRLNGEYIKQPHDDIGYYNILDYEHRIFMRKLAVRNNIYGFCYNYTWNGNNNEFLDKLRIDNEPNMPFMLCWKNDELDLNSINHFSYLLSFFKNKNYIRIGNKPVIVINEINYHNHIDISRIINEWYNLAIDNDLDGIYVMMNLIDQNIDIKLNEINGYVESNPMYTTSIYGNDIKIGAGPSIFEREFNEAVYLDKNKDVNSAVEAGKIRSGYEHYMNIGTKEKEFRTSQFYTYDGEITYDKLIETPRNYPIQHTSINIGWNDVAKRTYNNKKYSNYPHMYKYIDLDKFKRCFKRLLEKVYNDPNPTKHNNFIFINSWNCWSEGSALEPNDIDGYNYIESIRTIFNTQVLKKGGVLHICSKVGDVKRYIDDLETLYSGYNHITASSLKELHIKLQEYSRFNLIHIHDVINTDIGWDILDNMDLLRKKSSKFILTIHDYKLLYPTHPLINIDILKDEEVTPENMKRTKKLFSLSDIIIFPNDSVYDNYSNYIVLENYDDKIYVVPHNDIQHSHNSIWIPKIYDYKIEIAYIQNINDKKEMETINRLLNNHKEYNRYKINYTLYSKIEDIDRNKVHGILHLTNLPQTYSYELTNSIHSGLPIFYRKIGVFRTRLGDCEKYIGFTDDNLEVKLVEFIKYIISNANSYEYTPLTTNIQPNRWYIENYLDKYVD
jgi:hypothetical protein